MAACVMATDQALTLLVPANGGICGNHLGDC
jgi:hypothetical protein